MLTPKFVRTHYCSSTTSGDGLRWLFRLIYEFWGFCVNGDNDLVTPGGFAPTSGVYEVSWRGDVDTPDTGLLASGSDGYTEDGMPFFNTVNQNAFSSSWVNKWLVTWKSGSTSTDDSVYQITQWVNSSSVRVDVLHGATPYSASLHPTFTQRDQIHWRLVDFAEAAQVSLTENTSSLVLQFNGAPLVNERQRLSQTRLKYYRNISQNMFGLSFTLSPSGTWHGPEVIDEIETIEGFHSESISEHTNSSNWVTAATAQPAYITLIGAHDFLICHYKGQGSLNASGFHIEIPQRLYPYEYDPNPITVMSWNNSNALSAGTSGQGYAGGFVMHNPPDNTLLSYRGMSRRYFGHSDTNTPIGQTNGRFNGSFYNTYQNKFLFVDVVLAQGSVFGQYQAARARLRRVRILPTIIPQFERVGNNGEWIYVQSGIMWPWDNALLPYNLFLGGN